MRRPCVMLAALLAGFPALGLAAQLLVLNKNDHTLSFIDPQSGQTSATIPTGEGPHTRDGGISIIDVASNKVTQTVDAKTKRSNRLKFTRDGQWVLVTDLTAGELLILDAGKRTERGRLALGRIPTGILLTADGRQAYVAVSGENRIAVVDLTTMTIQKTIATGNSPDGMALVR